MRNTGVYYKNYEHADSVLEIRLCAETWDKVKRVAISRESSYSWVVRYALFRLIKHRNPKDYAKNVIDSRISPDSNEESTYDDFNNQVREMRHGSSIKHRHRLCLYGDDEIFVRLIAAQVGCTMTHLIRLALQMYLDSMLRICVRRGLRRFREAAWYWLGIKSYYDVEFHNIVNDKVSYQFNRFHELDYW